MPLAALFTLDLGQQRLGQLLAQFHAPLVEGVDAEELRLGKDAVFVERDQPPKRIRRELFIEEGDRRPIAGKDLVRRKRRRV